MSVERQRLRGTNIVETKIEVSDLQVNRGLTAEDFKIQFPPGTRIFDRNLNIVLRLYGRKASLEEIGRETCIDAEHHTTVKSLSQTLTNRGIYARGRKLKLEELQKQRFPAIILAQSPSYAKGENHFLVYVGSDENSLKLLDPLGFTALKAVPMEVFQKEWTGVAIVTQLIPFKGLEKSRSRELNILMAASIFLLLITLVMVLSSIRYKISLKKRCFDTGSTRIQKKYREPQYQCEPK